MADLRQRRGDPSQDELLRKDEEIERLKAELQAARRAQQAPTEVAAAVSEEEQKRQLLEKILAAVQEAHPARVKGTSDEALSIKEELEADPYNMDLILRLGLTYAKDGQWDKCCNVLMRGYKRVCELPSPEEAFTFLYALAEASHRTRKFRQALAVLNEMPVPTDEDQASALSTLKCMVYCENGDMERGLKAFYDALQGQSFERAQVVWSMCMGPLKRLGAYEVAKSRMLVAAAVEDEGQAKLEALEHLALLRDVFDPMRPEPKASKGWRLVVGVLISIAVLATLYALYMLERQSLARLRLKA